MAGWSDLDILEVMFRFRTLGQTAKQVALITASTRNSVLGHVHRVTSAAAQAEALRLRDHELLACAAGVLDGTRDAEAWAKVFAKARGVPVTRHAVLYLVWWVMNDAAVDGADDAVKAENRDWVAWPAWWRPVPAVGVAA